MLGYISLCDGGPARLRGRFGLPSSSATAARTRTMGGCSSAGRARGSEVRGQGFDPPTLHLEAVPWAQPTAVFARRRSVGRRVPMTVTWHPPAPRSNRIAALSVGGGSDSLSPMIPTPVEIRAAAERLRGITQRTPLVPSPELSFALGTPVYLNCENLPPRAS